MHTRSRTMSVALFAALLMLAVTALAPTALAATSATPSAVPAVSAPAGTPIPVGVIPDPHAIITSGNGKLWSGDSVQVNFSPNGSILDPAKCLVYINNNLQKLSSPPNIVYLSPSTPTLNFALTANYGKGSYDFKVIMVTTKGVTVEKTLSLIHIS